jgi:hypothetical protein
MESYIMTLPNRLPIHGRITLDQFLSFAGWQTTHGLAGMQTALTFYQDKIPRHILMKKAFNPHVYLLPRGGAIKLSELMQAIDFTKPVNRVLAGTNTRFKCFRPRNEAKSHKPKGHWFTELSSKQERLAIPSDQDLLRVYVVTTPVECLKSYASDAFTWIRRSFEEILHESITDKYYKGGGIQYFIWEPQRYLRLL